DESIALKDLEPNLWPACVVVGHFQDELFRVTRSRDIDRHPHRTGLVKPGPQLEIKVDPVGFRPLRNPDLGCCAPFGTVLEETHEYGELTTSRRLELKLRLYPTRILYERRSR